MSDPMPNSDENTPAADATGIVGNFGDVAAEYGAIVQGVAVSDLGCRGRFELQGGDRATFLHNMCTNEIRKLAVGKGCEAFFLNVQGKILGHAVVLCRPESLLLETAPGATPGLLEHLERYHIREAVEIHDRNHELGELLLAGPEARALLAPLVDGQLPASHLDGVETVIERTPVSLWRIELPPLIGYLIFAERTQAAHVKQLLVDAGARPAGAEAVEIARVEAGWPVFGRDISDRNLPQEVHREARTISFVKGCYLGQETVARIDALGHVNKLLVALRFDGPDAPAPATTVSSGGQVVGETTSAVMSPRLGAPLALAYVRRGSHAPGARLESALGPCEVVEPL
jgi:folate-binding protein YgfZ